MRFINVARFIGIATFLAVARYVTNFRQSWHQSAVDYRNETDDDWSARQW